MSKLTRATLTACAAAPLALLAACGSTAPPAASAQPQPTGQETQRKVENIIADCMKGKGFQYVPFVAPPFEAPKEVAKAYSGDYEALKSHRQKQGYGVFAIFVYPKELNNPMVEPDETAKPQVVNPNNEIRVSLSKSQHAAYQDANDLCYTKAVKDVTGKQVSGYRDHYEQAEARVGRLAAQELDGDARLVELAAATGSCLKAKGYTVASTKPTAIADRGRERFEAIKRPMGELIPEDVAKGLAAKKGERYEPNLSVEQARPYLDREVKDAMDDLECGKEFYPRYLPAHATIERRAYEEYGLR
ncbi:hypothetical protein [Spongiactinospora sp. TRM90649]|uniref:hypothetical protein n=1 Tax=Spongiactinospora sp. TRM90649 TaxID=3031114 RepID=UPI0023F6A75B|nr:hypothetical protein [Spongiactinospora sp. TRM90649]MDF5751618.1 hypothetical protein [Spongiactinospora sp. TRM90649]